MKVKVWNPLNIFYYQKSKVCTVFAIVFYALPYIIESCYIVNSNYLRNPIPFYLNHFYSIWDLDCTDSLCIRCCWHSWGYKNTWTTKCIEGFAPECLCLLIHLYQPAHSPQSENHHLLQAGNPRTVSSWWTSFSALCSKVMELLTFTSQIHSGTEFFQVCFEDILIQKKPLSNIDLYQYIVIDVLCVCQSVHLPILAHSSMMAGWIFFILSTMIRYCM